MSTSKRLAAMSLAATLCIAAAHAGSDDYDAANDTEKKGPAYFGFVRDSRGAAVPQARVTLTPRTGAEPLTLTANATGLYRSHFSADIAPADVQISCAKDGYRQINVSRRTTSTSTAASIETNCTLQRQ